MDAQATLKGQPDYDKYKKQLGVVSNGGILVCQGRMDLSDLAETAKKPILLPKNHKFSELVILDCHERVHHCKERATLAELRVRFWITKGRQYVKRFINSCFICKRFEGKPFNAPPFAPLPDFRVTEAPPFNRIGVDFAGLFKVACASCYLIFKCLQGTTIPNFASYAERVSHNYGTRGNKATLRVPRVRTEAAKKSFWFQGPSCYNELPIEIRSLESFVVFKHRLKEHLQLL